VCNRACLAKLYDGGLVKETRESGSKLLRLRFKLLQLDRKWERRSFGTSDVDAAIEKSKKFYNEYQARIEDGILADYEKSFGDICQAYKDQLLELKTRVGCTNLFNS
jgi:hypothetical protein